MTQRTLRALRACLVIFIATCCSPAAADGGATSIEIVDRGAGLAVIYRTRGLAASLSFGGDERPNPFARITTPDEGASIRDGTIVESGPARRFSMLVRPDVAEREAAYPVLTLLSGTGYVLFAPYILPEGAIERIDYVDSGGRRTRVDIAAARRGYIVLARASTRMAGYDLTTARDVPRSLVDLVASRADKLLSFYAREMRYAAPIRPRIVIAAPRGRTGVNRGDVTDNGVIFLRFAFDSSTSNGASFRDRATAFLAHELFHLWTNRTSRDPRAQWLHEGAAEYAGWNAAAVLWPEEAAPLEQRLDTALNTCVSGLRSSPFVGPRLGSQRLDYPCGALLQWTSDVNLRASGRRSVADLWRATWSRRTSDAVDPLTMFNVTLARLAPAAPAMLDLILWKSGSGRWSDLATGLNRLGASIETRPADAFSVRVAATQSLVLSACRIMTGVGERDGSLFATAPSTCATFGDGPVIVSVEGVSPMAAPQEYFDLIQSRCSRKQSISAVLSAGGRTRTETILCDAQVQPPPPRFIVKRAFARF